MTYGGHALAYAILPAEYSTKFSSCSGTFRFKRPNDTSDASRGCVAPSTTSSELSLSAARNRSGNQQRGAVGVESIAPSRLIGRNRPDADIEMTRRKAFPAILRLRDRSYRNRLSKCSGRPLGLCGRRLPELNLIPIQVIDPGKATVGFIHSFGVNLYSLLF